MNSCGVLAVGCGGSVLGGRSLAVSRRELPANKDPRQAAELPSFWLAAAATSLLDGIRV
jgi:hypothetical protein